MGSFPEMSVEAERILILGTGAMACLFAARLAACGAQVTLLGTWAEGLQALQQHGVRLVELNGDEKYYPIQATADPQVCWGIRLCLVLVKAWQTGRAAGQLGEC
jgi:2-dehydropantoate 2-reductase